MKRASPAHSAGELAVPVTAPQVDVNGDVAPCDVDIKTMSAKTEDKGSISMDAGKSLRVYYSDETERRRRTTCETYLIAICVLLCMLCIVFIVLALTWNQKGDHDVCSSESCVRTAAQLLEAMDQTADPCHDFFQFACGGWNRKHTIPEDKPTFNTFEKLHDELQVKLKVLLEESSSPSDTVSTRSAKTLYTSCINTPQIERVGDSPLVGILTDLGGWPVVHDFWDAQQWRLEDVIGRLRSMYVCPVLIDMQVGTDDKNSSARVIQLDQLQLGMPSREYYLEDDSVHKSAYYKYMVNVATILGANRTTAELDMSEVLEFEIKLANISIPPAEQHDTGALYTKLTVSDLSKEVPQLQWMRFLKTCLPINITQDEPVVSYAMEYMREMGELLTTTKPRTLANYILWRFIMSVAPELTQKFQRERQDYDRVMQGVSQVPARWRKCVEYVNERLGMAVGRLFVLEHFKKESKDTALEMIHNLREAFNEILLANEWMDDETKAVAREKANAMNERVGYPESILNDTELDAVYQGNVFQIERHDSQKHLLLLRKPVNKDKWQQNPAVVNAFFNPNKNDIVIPAGILQPLFYSGDFPKSLNFGGIGVVIGHEITHGFDDKGRQYDKDGNIRQWWNNQTVKRFQQRAQCMIDQYSSYTLEPVNLPINGKNTQGENIADNGGLKQSFRAYRMWVERNGEESPLPGINLSHNQLFFLNYAQIWCGLMRNEYALQKTRSAVHSPDPIRVRGPLSNSLDFAAAYKCPEGSSMNPKKKCSVW